MADIVVIGGGGHAKVLVGVLKKLSPGAIAGYTDPTDRGALLGVPYLGDDAVLSGLLARCAGLRGIIGVGKLDASDQRLRLQEKLHALGLHFPPLVSPAAIVNEEVALGEGTAVMDGVVVNPGTTVGAACILNTNCTVEHDCTLGANVHIAPGTTLSGGVCVGDNCLIGTGARVIQGVTICAGALVGAGSTVVRDLTVPGTYLGSPARRVA